jgi:hypothetical protein
MSGPSYCPFAQRDMRQSKMQTELRKRVSRDRSVGSKSGFADHEDRPVILSICQSEVEVPFIGISCSAGVPPTRWITVSAGGAWATRDSSAAGEDARQTAAFPIIPGGSMDSTSPSTKWTPYEVKAASILYERRTEDLQLEQLWIRLQKKIREAESRASEPTAA